MTHQEDTIHFDSAEESLLIIQGRALWPTTQIETIEWEMFLAKLMS